MKIPNRIVILIYLHNKKNKNKKKSNLLKKKRSLIIRIEFGDYSPITRIKKLDQTSWTNSSKKKKPLYLGHD